MSLCAAVALGLAAWLAFPGRAHPPAGSTDRRTFRPRAVSASAVVVGLAILGLPSIAPTSYALGVIALLSGWGLVQLWLRRREARRAEARSEQVLLACESMAGDLAVGADPLAALRRVAADWAEFAPVAGAGELHADVPGALRVLAARPGAEQLCEVAAAWQVAHRSGAGLASALAQAADQVRDARAVSRTVAAELAASRATARLMSLLPVAVLGLGATVGGDPIGFLLRSPAGVCCLAVGVALLFAGTVWTDRIADRVSR